MVRLEKTLCCVTSREPPPSEVFSGRKEKSGINRVNSKRVQTDFKGPFGNGTPGLCCSHLSRRSKPPWYLLFCRSEEGECADQEIPQLVLSLKSLVFFVAVSVPLNIALMVLFLNNTGIFCADQLFQRGNVPENFTNVLLLRSRWTPAQWQHLNVIF